jgi:hypothetical protein
MKCKEHPRYVATRHPVKTQKHPDGCPTCWGVWEAAKTDPRRRANTVTVELDMGEARAMVLLMSRGMGMDSALMDHFYQVLARAVRDA